LDLESFQKEIQKSESQSEIGEFGQLEKMEKLEFMDSRLYSSNDQ